MGDAGSTGSLSGKKFRKNDTPIEVLGTADEAITQVEKCSILIEQYYNGDSDPAIKKDLSKITEALYNLMAEISNGKASGLSKTVQTGYVERLERRIDEITLLLPKQTKFVFFKTIIGIELSEARVRIRKLERDMTQMLRHDIIRPVLFQYVNRLSDYMYILSVYLEKNNDREYKTN